MLNAEVGLFQLIAEYLKINVKPRCCCAINGGQRTNLPDVFAIGDCAEINGQLLPYLAPINAGSPALADCLLGRPTMVNYPLMPVIVKTTTYPLTLYPPAHDLNGHWQIENSNRGTRALFIDDNQQLQGFVLSEELGDERQYWLDRIRTTL
ncbi:hypothetical protein M3I01_010690 [Marinomonas sp. RSW2]|uniref:Rubredoxin binding domain-containing protein n=1 Tax=Marinomonas maritima TaxID=2940935 RepID=A0ABT5WFB5_9GAMM|nr:hypothetical protein [Marinomonas maritima]MDE8603377.1 hypothetical protein [Marinomonas maritima]